MHQLLFIKRNRFLATYFCVTPIPKIYGNSHVYQDGYALCRNIKVIRTRNEYAYLLSHFLGIKSQ